MTAGEAELGDVLEVWAPEWASVHGVVGRVVDAQRYLITVALLDGTGGGWQAHPAWFRPASAVLALAAVGTERAPESPPGAGETVEALSDPFGARAQQRASGGS